MLIEVTQSTRYADVVVTCDERDLNPAARVIRHPRLVVEMLSESTASMDLGPKMREYQGIAEPNEYLLVN